ncbi:hypothetical protein JC796_06405 [Delftia acidovorans]|uniref:hypothetical protein n=1 Tax=Delftia acidovorans TaxID=80866 RepID=UPI0018E86E79|nr:hypothetical protein [Delftia acidovorans]MBJ2140354.1 hypothetical protein [Delftia acidovorans]
MSVRWLMACGPKTTRINIAAHVRSPDIRALAVAAGWDGAGQIVLTINSGIDVAALRVENIPHDVLHIVVNSSARMGGLINGGTALYTRTRIQLTNGGTMFGGGGSGGGGGQAWVKYLFDDGIYWAFGGNGGRGAGFSESGAVTMLSQTGGDSGAYWRYGGAVLGGETAPWAEGGAGGAGGAIGQAGIGGSYATWGGSYQDHGEGLPSNGQAAGCYVDGNAYVTWLATGTRLGRVI